MQQNVLNQIRHTHDDDSDHDDDDDDDDDGDHFSVLSLSSFPPVPLVLLMPDGDGW